MSKFTTMKLKVPFLFSLFLLLVGSVAAQNIEGLARQFESSSTLKSYFYGFSLYDPELQQTLFEVNGDKYFTPASNTKVFTLYTSLLHLPDSLIGLEYIEKGDSLIFFGAGDPTFLHPKLGNDRVLEFLKNSDKKLFYAPQSAEEPHFRAGWAIDDYAYAYQPNIAVFPIYGNLVRLSARGGELAASPKYFEQFINRQREAGTIDVKRELESNAIFADYRTMPRNFSKSIPFLYSDEVFVNLLSDTLGRAVELIEREKPVGASRLYSTDLKPVLREMMLPSDNFLAEQLAMQVAYEKFGAFDTRKLQEYMQENYYQHYRTKVQFRDASGLSVYNKVTPRAMVDVLDAIRQLLSDEKELFYYFPAGGVDGTLKGVYPLDKGRPFVWAKTGTIHAAHAQSGYIKTRSGRTLIFSFLNANYLGSSLPVRNEMVRIVSYIHQNF